MFGFLWYRRVQPTLINILAAVILLAVAILLIVLRTQGVTGLAEAQGRWVWGLIAVLLAGFLFLTLCMIYNYLWPNNGVTRNARYRGAPRPVPSYPSVDAPPPYYQSQQPYLPAASNPAAFPTSNPATGSSVPFNPYAGPVAYGSQMNTATPHNETPQAVPGLVYQPFRS